MTLPTQFYGPNLGYLIEQYEKYQQAPDSVDAQTAAFFRDLSPEAFYALFQPQSNGSAAPASAAGVQAPAHDLRKVVGAVGLANAIRQFGHTAAQLDPLGSIPPGDPALIPATHGINEADLQRFPASLIVSGPIGEQSNDALEAIQQLREVYCGSIGYDNEHLEDPLERQWLRDSVESRRFRYEASEEQDRDLLTRLTEIETMEHFLQRSFPSKYRFSIEGLDMMVPMLDEIVESARESEAKNVFFGMAHRGRLNVLAHIMERDYRRVLADFNDTEDRARDRDAIGWTMDDVKYHKGATLQKGGLTLKMASNPSHLEQVNPVVVGMARAAATDSSRGGAPTFERSRTMQVLIHGDAAFPGQGIVAETFNLSGVPGFAVGGTIHIIANNQLGFTTMPDDSRTTRYASDMAKGFGVPIIHVNADDPAACIEVARLAFAYQNEFEKDILIDLVGYRRYGHNELDEPGFTHRLIRRGLMDTNGPQKLYDQHMTSLQDQLDTMPDDQEGIADPHVPLPEPGIAGRIDTAIPADQLIAINDALTGTLEGFNFYSKRFEKSIRSRRTTLNDPAEKAMDWATAEEFAFASILSQGIPIRLTGQDTQRGTFSHRHAVLHDAETGAELIPLQELPLAEASIEIHNSPLSEAAIVGFEYGYNIQAKNTLVIWEAQYGDFVNGAQAIIDEFLVSGREKWGELPSLVMLLPHAHEGAGPDHSSARLERFLSMAAKTNMRVAYPSTSAQYFHLLRRQALLLERDPLPLVVMSPKSLLRNPAVAASMNDLTTGSWNPVLDDEWVQPEDVTRLVFVTGKFYYDLAGAEYREQYPHVAIVRVEQLYPFPTNDLKEVLARYPNVKQIVWAQEEPKNMGAFDFMQYRLKKLVGMGTPVNYVGRRRSSSPVCASQTRTKPSCPQLKMRVSSLFHTAPDTEESCRKRSTCSPVATSQTIA